MISKARNAIVAVVRLLETADRVNAYGYSPAPDQKDEPEGAIHIRISDTLAREIAAELRGIAEELGLAIAG